MHNKVSFKLRRDLKELAAGTGWERALLKGMSDGGNLWSIPGKERAKCPQDDSVHSTAAVNKTNQENQSIL